MLLLRQEIRILFVFIQFTLIQDNCYAQPDISIICPIVEDYYEKAQIETKVLFCNVFFVLEDSLENYIITDCNNPLSIPPPDTFFYCSDKLIRLYYSFTPSIENINKYDSIINHLIDKHGVSILKRYTYSTDYDPQEKSYVFYNNDIVQIHEYDPKGSSLYYYLFQYYTIMYLDTINAIKRKYYENNGLLFR